MCPPEDDIAKAWNYSDELPPLTEMYNYEYNSNPGQVNHCENPSDNMAVINAPQSS